MHVEKQVITTDPTFTDNTVNSTTLYKLSHGNCSKDYYIILHFRYIKIYPQE